MNSGKDYDFDLDYISSDDDDTISEESDTEQEMYTFINKKRRKINFLSKNDKKAIVIKAKHVFPV